MKYTLYGDGINDDTLAIQELLDSGMTEVALPTPPKCYMISKTLKLHGGQTLKLGQFTTIRLMPNSNCAMLEDDDFRTQKKNICIDGGIWDMNNTEQAPNPWHYPDEDGNIAWDKIRQMGSIKEFTVFPAIYTGYCMRFCRIQGLIIKNITLKNPVTYGVQIGYTENFTIRDIRFDYTTGAPKLWNMDGIHIEGHCKNGTLCNLKGACHDDLVAITADDQLYGPIENITIDGIYAEHSHSAVRLLSHGIPIKNIKISNIYGSYYTYCIGLTKYHGGEDERGSMKNILIENVAACASKGTADVKGGTYPFLWVQSGLDIEGLSIRDVYREEHTFPTPLLKIDAGATVKKAYLFNIYQKNRLEEPIPFIIDNGETEFLTQQHLFSE